MAINYKVEHKVSHHEWDEVTIPADDFFKLFELVFTDDDDEDVRLFTLDHYPSFHFENDCVCADEIWSVKAGKVDLSSLASGVAGWSDKHNQYTRLTHGHITELGNLVSVTFTLDDDLRHALEAIEEQAA